MEDYHYPHLFTSGTLLPTLAGSVSNEHNNIQFDTVVDNFDSLCYYDYMISGARFLDDHDHDHVLIDSGISAFPGVVDVAVPASPGLISSLIFNGYDDPGTGCGAAAAAEADQNSTGGEGNSSGTAATKPKRDRSKTLVSERTRRGRMKEKLYELRSLVPNITKMDKASIIADAVVYMQSLQNQAKKLAEEISVLESSLKEEQVLLRGPAEIINGNASSECGGKIMEVVAQEVAEGNFYLKVVCNKGEGVAPSLYAAIDSLQHFQMESSNFSCTSDKFVLVVILNVKGLREGMGASSVKLWMMGALLKEGFNFDMSL